MTAKKKGTVWALFNIYFWLSAWGWLTVQSNLIQPKSSSKHDVGGRAKHIQLPKLCYGWTHPIIHSWRHVIITFRVNKEKSSPRSNVTHHLASSLPSQTLLWKFLPGKLIQHGNLKHQSAWDGWIRWISGAYQTNPSAIAAPDSTYL